MNQEQQLNFATTTMKILPKTMTRLTIPNLVRDSIYFYQYLISFTLYFFFFTYIDADLDSSKDPVRILDFTDAIDLLRCAGY